MNKLNPNRLKPKFHDTSKPLVSVLIFNYNYGRYLRECFESVFKQTYDNIEICFSDNSSDDESWDIALEYANKYPGVINITRNRINFGPDANYENCAINVRGKYIMRLCSDDAFMPECIEKCVNALESYSAGFAMVHRTIIDEQGNRTDEPPFYNQTCIIPGAEQAAVYMMATVNPSISQIMYDYSKLYKKSAGHVVGVRWYSSRIMDFNICCEYNIVYIKEPLLLHRIHLKSEQSAVVENLLDVFGPYILQHQFADMALHIPKVVKRLPASLEKLSRLSLRYCSRFLCQNNEKNAFRYFHLAQAIDPDIINDPIFTKLQQYWVADSGDKIKIIEYLQSIDNLLTRSISYDPPPGSIPIEI